MNFSRINIVFLSAALLFLMCYVIEANGMAAQAWQARDTQRQLAALRETRNGLVAQEAALGDRVQLMALAQRSGMVPADSAVVYLVQDRPVAAR